MRNPWDRMVSYYQWLRGQSFDHAAVQLAKGKDFSGFLKAPFIREALRAQPYRSYMTAADGIEYCNAYIRLEHLDEDAEALWAHLGFHETLPLSNRSSRREDYRSYYSDDDAELLAEICAQDIQRFGYRF